MTNTSLQVFLIPSKFLYKNKACDNGEIRVYNVEKEKVSYTMYSSKPGVPFSYVKWRPKSGYKAKNVFVSVNAEGEIQHWHLFSGILFIMSK